jgi:hypothetical protein
VRSGPISRLVIGTLAAVMLLASATPVASAKLGGFHENWFGRENPDDLGLAWPDGRDGTAQLLDAASASGAAIARVNVLWCQLEPTDDFFAPGAWNTTIANINRIVSAGMRPLPILINAPVWARADGDRPPPGTPGACAQQHEQRDDETDAEHKPDAAYPPGDGFLEDWNEFVSRFIKCMRNIGNAGGGCPDDLPGGNLEVNTPPIQGYEIWNESNLGKYWGKAEVGTLGTDDADKFARMVRGAFAVPHSRPVVLGGLSFPNTGNWGAKNVAATCYLHRVYNLWEVSSPEPQADAIGMHPYGSGLHTNAEKALERWRALRKVVRDNPAVGCQNGESEGGHDDQTTQIWVTEVGDQGCPQQYWDDYTVCPPNLTDFGLQGSRLRNMWIGDNALPVPVIVYYRLMDTCRTGPERPLCRDIDTGRRMGVFPWRNFHSPRPAYCLLAAQWGAYPSDCG